MNKALLLVCMSMAMSMTLAVPAGRLESNKQPVLKFEWIPFKPFPTFPPIDPSQWQSGSGCYQYQSSDGTSVQVGEGCKQSQSSSGTSGQQQQGGGSQSQSQSGSGSQWQSQSNSGSQSPAQSGTNCYQYQSSDGTSVQVGEGCNQSQSSSGTSSGQQQQWQPIEWKPIEWKPIEWQPMNGGQSQSQVRSARQLVLPVVDQQYQQMIQALINAYNQNGFNGVMTLINQQYPQYAGQLQAILPLLQQIFSPVPQSQTRAGELYVNEQLLANLDAQTKEMIQALINAYNQNGYDGVIALMTEKYPQLFNQFQIFMPLIEQYLPPAPQVEANANARQLVLPVMDDKTKEMIQSLINAYQTGGPNAAMALITQKYPELASQLQVYMPLIQQFILLDPQQQQQQLDILSSILQG